MYTSHDRYENYDRIVKDENVERWQMDDLPKTVLLHDLLHCAAEQGKEEEDGHDVD